MRPRLKSGVVFLPTSTGVVIEDGEQYSLLSGEDAGPFLDRLEPFLRGDHTLGEILESVSPPHRSKIAGVIDSLHARGFIRNLETHAAHSLTSSEISSYQPSLTLLDRLTDSAEYRFSLFRAADIAVINQGTLSLEMASSLVRMGARGIRMLSVRGQERYMDVSSLSKEWLPAQAETLPTDLPGEWGRPDLLVCCPAPQEVGSSIPFADSCARLNLPVYLVVATDDGVFSGFLFARSGDENYARWLRLSNVRSSQFAKESPLVLDAPVLERVTQHAAFTIMRYLSEIPTPTTTIDELTLPSLTFSRNEFAPQPASGATAPKRRESIAQAISRLKNELPLEADVVARSSIAPLDENQGIISDYDERDLVHLPLFVSRLRVEHPEATKRGLASHHGFGESLYDARLMAWKLAVGAYSSLVFDENSVIQTEQSTDSGVSASRPRSEPDLNESSYSGVTVGAYDLSHDRETSIAASAAFPQLLSDCNPGDLLSGLAVGLSYSEAVWSGLEDVARLTLLANMDEVDVRCSFAADLQEFLDPPSRQLLEVLSFSGRSVEIWALMGRMGIPVFAFSVDGVGISSVLAIDPVRAVRRGMRACVAAVQGLPVPHCLAVHPGLELPDPRTVRKHFDQSILERRSDSEELLKSLLETDHRVLLVPLDHDAFVARCCPFVFRVVIIEEIG